MGKKNKKIKIFITGSSGFIGFSSALNFVKLGFRVHGYDSINKYYDQKLKFSRNKILKKYRNFSFTKGNLENYKKIEKEIIRFKPEIILHFAAQAGVRYSISNSKEYLFSNIIGTYNILEIVKKLKVKHLLIASSSSVYGANTSMPFKETDKADKQLSVYASTKKATENLAHSYSSLWNISITILRFFTVYGPWGRPDMAIFKFTKNILSKKKIDIYNKGKMYRDFTFIDDVVKSIELLVAKPPKKKSNKKFFADSLSNVAPFRIVNIGNEKKVYLKDFIKEIEKNLKIKANYNFLPMQKGDVKQTLSNTTLLKNITKFKPGITYKIGIEKFIKWYKSYYK